MEVQLVNDDAEVADHAFVLDSRPVNVGRSRENDVCLGDPEVSRHHCELQRIEDVIVVADLASSNGTFVNGLRITQAILKPGDKLTLGRLAFRIYYDRDSTEVSPLTESTDDPAMNRGKGWERLLHAGRLPGSLEAAVDSGPLPDVTPASVSSESRGLCR
jgi:predicted component of type VI protein secretion system